MGSPEIPIPVVAPNGAPAVPTTPVVVTPATPPPGGGTPATAPATPKVPQTMEEAFAQIVAPPETPAAAPTPEPAPAPAPEPGAPPDTPEIAVSSGDEPIDGPDSQDAEGRRFFFNRPKAERLLADHQALRQFREIVPDISPESFREMAGRANAAQVMMGTFHRAADMAVPAEERFAAMDDIVGYFGEQNPVALGVMAIRAQQAVAKNNPQAFQAIRNMHTQQLMGDIRNRISQIVDPGKKQEEVNFFQNLELRLTGKYTPTDQLLNGAAPQQQVDPRANDLQQREQRMQEWERNRQREASTFLDRNIGNSVVTEQRSAVDAALSPFKARLNGLQYEYLASALLQEVANAENAHPEWGEQDTALRTQARLTGAPADINRLAKYRGQIAQRVIRTKGPQVVSEFMGRPSGTPSNGAGVPAPLPNEPSLVGSGTPANPNGVNNILKQDNWADVFKAAGL